MKSANIDYILFKLLKALLFLHKKLIVHRDIKPSNILIDQYSEIKLADFGLSRTLRDSKRSELDENFIRLQREKQMKMGLYGAAVIDENVLNLTDYVASRWYRAPEILLGSLNYGFTSDIWSLGCILGKLTLL